MPAISGKKVGLLRVHRVWITVSELTYRKMQRLGELADKESRRSLREQVAHVMKVALEDFIREADRQLPELRSVTTTAEGAELDRAERARKLRAIRKAESMRVIEGRRIDSFSEFHLQLKDREFIKNKLEEARLRAIGESALKPLRKGERIVEGQSRRVK